MTAPKVTATMRDAWYWVVTYLIPGKVYRPWCRFVWRPLRYGTSPWAKSSCEDCPTCQAIEAAQNGSYGAVEE